MAKKQHDLRSALVELVEALESCELVNEIEAGCEGDGAYVRACRALRRKPKLDPDCGIDMDDVLPGSTSESPR